MKSNSDLIQTCIYIYNRAYVKWNIFCISNGSIFIDLSFLKQKMQIQQQQKPHHDQPPHTRQY